MIDSSHYLEWNRNKIKAIIDFFGFPFFQGKKVLDLGCLEGDVGAAFYRLGADVICVDARSEHLKIVARKYPGIKVQCVDLDHQYTLPWADIVLNLGLICHLKNFERHLREVCKNCAYLVLETAVCDSEDNNLALVINESKNIYDLSFNGFSSHPTGAMIERILEECGFEVKRIDSAKLNAGKYKYDWQPQNNGARDMFRRRFFVGKKRTDIGPPLRKLPEKIMGGQQLHVPYNTQSIAVNFYNKSVNLDFLSANGKTTAYSDDVKKNSQEFALVRAENINPPMKFPTEGIILPLTISSREWFKKIAPLFPNLKVHHSAHTMRNFQKSNDRPNVVMCSIGHLVSNKNIWIEEWSNTKLSEDDISTLRACGKIMTPSLLNAQEILHTLPDARVVRVARPWPIYDIPIEKHNKILYFEKDQSLTRNLLLAWDEGFGELIVVGSSIQLPKTIDYISNCEDYSKLLKLIIGARAIVGLSNNNYYASGIEELIKALHIPLITNNYYNTENKSVILINQDKTKTPNISEQDLINAVSKFISRGIKNEVGGYNEFNYDLNNMLTKMLED